MFAGWRQEDEPAIDYTPAAENELVADDDMSTTDSLSSYRASSAALRPWVAIIYARRVTAGRTNRSAVMIYENFSTLLGDGIDNGLTACLMWPLCTGVMKMGRDLLPRTIYLKSVQPSAPSNSRGGEATPRRARIVQVSLQLNTVQENGVFIHNVNVQLKEVDRVI